MFVSLLLILLLISSACHYSGLNRLAVCFKKSGPHDVSKREVSLQSRGHWDNGSNFAWPWMVLHFAFGFVRRNTLHCLCIVCSPWVFVVKPSFVIMV